MRRLHLLVAAKIRRDQTIPIKDSEIEDALLLSGEGAQFTHPFDEKGKRNKNLKYSALSSLLFRGKNAVHNKKMKEGRKERKIMGRLLYYRTESISRKSS